MKTNNVNQQYKLKNYSSLVHLYGTKTLRLLVIFLFCCKFLLFHNFYYYAHYYLT